jgi:Flp pilus assembly protein TadG
MSASPGFNALAWLITPPLRLLRRFRRDQGGAYAVEMALVAVPFFALLFATFDTAMIFFKNEYLQTAVSDAGRLIFTGQAQTEGFTQQQFKDVVCDRAKILISCGDIAVDVRTSTSFDEADSSRFAPIKAGNFNDTGLKYQPGSRGSIVVVSAYTQHTMFVPMIANIYSNLSNGKILLSASAAFRNEPYN